MAEYTIPDLTPAGTLTGTEELEVSGGKKTTALAIANLSGVGGAQVANRVLAGPTAGAAAPAAFRVLVPADIPALPAPALPATQIGFGGAGGLMTSDANFTYSPNDELRVRFGDGAGFYANNSLKISKIGDFNLDAYGDVITVDGINILAYYDNTAHNGKFGINTAAPTSALQAVGVPQYANRTAALAGGLTAGAFYSLPISGDNKVTCIV